MKPKTIHDMSLLRTTITFLFALLILAGCQEDDEGTTVEPFTGESKTYLLNETNDSGVNGYVVFTQEEGGPLEANITLLGTDPNKSYPVDIYTGATIEEGNTVGIPLGTVPGGTGELTVPVSNTTFEQLIAYDGYIGATDNGAFVVLNDLGGNELSGTSKEYTLAARNGSGLAGTITFTKRNNNTTLVTIEMDSTVEGQVHPSHIHANSAAEGGNIVLSFTPVEGGMSTTNVRAFDDGTPVTYDELIGDADDEDDIFGYDGYVNVHRSSNDLTVISQTDIGSNELTGESVEYPLGPVDVAGISGTATFEQRKNNETLVTIALEGTPAEGVHPAHIHANTAAEGGEIVIPLTNVDGATGMSMTNIGAFVLGEDTDSLTYSRLIDYDGYINVHQSETQLDVIVAQGDIGQNALTGESVTYALDSVANSPVKGTATFSQRNNGNTLVEIMLEGTTDGEVHPAYILSNTAAGNGSEIAITLDSIDGTTGMSSTSVSQFDDGTEVSYEQLIDYDGFISVVASPINSTAVALGDIGQNALTGDQETYEIEAVDGSGVTGTVTFAERENGTSLISVNLNGTSPGNSHPVFIQADTINTDGRNILTLNPVDGDTGLSRTTVEELDNGLEISYEALADINGHITVRLGPGVSEDVIVAQGNVGSNIEAEGEETETEGS